MKQVQYVCVFLALWKADNEAGTQDTISVNYSVLTVRPSKRSIEADCSGVEVLKILETKRFVITEDTDCNEIWEFGETCCSDWEKRITYNNNNSPHQ